VTGIARGQCRLVEEVIDRGICVRCGACVGLCPYFSYFDGKILVMDRCEADTGRCLQACPRAAAPPESCVVGKGEVCEEEGIGPCKRIVMARTTERDIQEKAQYGGVVSTLAIHVIQTGRVDAFVLTDRGSRFAPRGRTARNRDEVLSCAGSRYSASGGLSALNGALKAGEDRLGVIGLPCQMEALARMRPMGPNGGKEPDRVKLKIGLFCTWAVDYRGLHAFLKKKGVQGPVRKFDIPPPPSEVFQVWTEEGRKAFSLSEIRPLIQKGCTLCQDMTAERTDISVGTVEGQEGWNVVLIRTDRGLDSFNEAIEEGRLETAPLPDENLKHLEQAARNKRQRGKQAQEAMSREVEA
jgi:coenzyme F420 hydrogenase subunit beta